VKKFKVILASALLFLLVAEPAFAVVKVEQKNPDFTINYVNPGDQVNSGLLVGSSLLVFSTIENPTLNGANAVLTSYGLDGSKQWELPVTGESVAGAIARDSLGNIYLLGATMTPQTQLPPSPQTATINPDNVQIDPVTKPTNTLSSIAIWKISSTGALIQFFTLPMNEAVIPNSISYSTAGFLIGASTAKKYFQVTMNESGIFGTPTYLKPPKALDLSQDLKYGSTKLKFLTSAKSLIGIPSWKPKKPTPVLIQYTKFGNKRAVNSFQGNPVFIFNKSGIGVIVGSELANGFGISIVKPLN
jgi:hypothetical protein